MKISYFICLSLMLSIIFLGCCSNGNGNGDGDSLTISITFPRDDDTVSAVLVIRATPNPSADFVQFIFDTFLQAIDSASPYEASFDISDYRAGRMVAYATAHKGELTATDSVSFYIEEVGTKWVRLTSPADGETVEAVVMVNAMAEPTPQYIEFRYGIFSSVRDSTEPFGILLLVYNQPEGNYTLSATAHWADTSITHRINIYVRAAESGYMPVLVEDFTNVYCSPCVNVAAALDGVRSHYESIGERPIMVEFHNNLNPNDPFYQASPELHMSRYNYYGFTSVPQLVVDGAVLTASERTDPDAIVAKIEAARSTVRTATIVGTAFSSSDTIYLYGTIDSDGMISGRLFCYVVRRLITFTTPPGTNGLEEFHYSAAISMVDIAGRHYDETPVIPLALRCLKPPELPGGVTAGYTVVVFMQDETTGRIFCANAFDVENR